MANDKFDFSGYATKYNIKCADGRTIMPGAFDECDGMTVPIVFSHSHDNPQNVLGHGVLECRPKGVYIYGSFNSTKNGKAAKEQVRHGDIQYLSIFANHLQHATGTRNVMHGMIREVSLVLAGANPGAKIDNPILMHGEGYYEEEAIITNRNDIRILFHDDVDDDEEEFEEDDEYDEEDEDDEYDEEDEDDEYDEEDEDEDDEDEDDEDEEDEEDEDDEDDEDIKHGDDGVTYAEIFDEMTEDQQACCLYLVNEAVKYSENGGNDEMRHNIFDCDEEYEDDEVLSHEDMEAIFEDAKTLGSLKEAVLAHGDGEAVYGTINTEYLFPDDRAINPQPDFIKRDTGWVGQFMGAVHHTPFSRVKSLHANITADEARARGYIKGKRKLEEVFTLLKRTTTPQTIYKKQKADRDDILDITDFSYVAFLKGEMRGMLDEEIARACLIGDGRSPASDDKIDPNHVRPVWTDDDLYTIKYRIHLPTTATEDDIARAFIRGCIKARKEYKGSGNPVLYTTEEMLTSCLLLTDTTGRDIYDTEEKLRTKLRVSKIVTVELMEGATRQGLDGANAVTLMLGGIILNERDYNIGADKGGNVEMFDDFDIDYNQYKYLIETRCSGALTKPYSAIAVEFDFNVNVGVAPEASTTSMLGKLVSALQSGITVTNDGIQGTLKYVTGYTGYSGDPALQEGNFLAIKFTAPDDATVRVGLEHGEGGMVTLDSDMNAVVRITNNINQNIIVEVTTSGGAVVTRKLSLDGLTMLSE